MSGCDGCVAEESSEDFPDLEEIPGYAEIDGDVATCSAGSNDQIITGKIPSADETTIVEECDEEKQEVTTPIVTVTKAKPL